MAQFLPWYILLVSFVLVKGVFNLIMNLFAKVVNVLYACFQCMKPLVQLSELVNMLIFCLEEFLLQVIFKAFKFPTWHNQAAPLTNNISKNVVDLDPAEIVSLRTDSLTWKYDVKWMKYNKNI